MNVYGQKQTLNFCLVKAEFYSQEKCLMIYFLFKAARSE